MMAYGDSPCQIVPPPLPGQKQRAKKKQIKLPTEKEKWNDCKYLCALMLVPMEGLVPILVANGHYRNTSDGD